MALDLDHSAKNDGHNLLLFLSQECVSIIIPCSPPTQQDAGECPPCTLCHDVYDVIDEMYTQQGQINIFSSDKAACQNHSKCTRCLGQPQALTWCTPKDRVYATAQINSDICIVFP